MRWTQIHIAVEGRGDVTGGDAQGWLSENFPGLVRTHRDQPGVVVLSRGGKVYFRETEIVRELTRELGDAVSFTMDGGKKARDRLRNALHLRRHGVNAIDNLAYYEIEVVHRTAAPPIGSGHDADYRLSTADSEDGDYAAVANDDPILGGGTHYKLSIRDLHTVADVSSDECILGTEGETISRPADYARNGWMRKVRCAVGLRVTLVRKDRNGVQLPMPEGVSVVWSVIDPPPTFVAEASEGAQQPRKWLERFYRLTAPRGAGRYRGNKNCPRRYGGVREDNGGVRATSVLSEVRGGALQPLAGYSESEARCKTTVDNGRGVADVFFCPPPIGGDTYRLSISVVGGEGERFPLRHVVANIPGPRQHSLQTGVITIWKTFPISYIFRLEIEDTIDWDAVKAAFRPAYIDIAKDFAATTDFYINSGSLRGYITKAFGHDLHGFHDGVLLPDSVSQLAQAGVDDVVKEVVGRICKANFGVPNPNDGEANGLYVVVCGKLTNDTDLVGLYVGVGQFLSTFYCDVTKTCKHEMGHAFHLRHGITMPLYTLEPSADTETVTLSDFPYDHDPADTTSCLMSYGNDRYAAVTGGYMQYDLREIDHPVNTHFCGVCLLKLRFWDTVKMRHDDAFRTMIERDRVARTIYVAPPQNIGDPQVPTLDASGGGTAAGTIVLGHATREPGGSKWGAMEIRDRIACNTGAKLHLVPLAAPDPIPANRGGLMWMDLSNAAEGCWHTTNRSVATVENGIVEAAAPGSADIYCLVYGKASNFVRVEVA